MEERQLSAGIRRHSQFAHGCRLLLLALAGWALTACNSLPTKPPTADPSSAAALAQTDPTASSALQPAVPPMPVPATLSPVPDLWTRFASGRHWKTCELSPGAQHWVSRYASKPERFAAALAPVAPLMEYVLTQAEAHGLPSEVMLVPIVESHYRADARGPAGALGMWQLMPDTGRRFGLVGHGSDDDRLDVLASTAAALRLLRLNADAFSDNPKLMFAAYNAGAYRLRKALAGRDHHSLTSLDGLGLSRTTREYIDKLKALGCLLGEPERFAMELPAVGSSARLVEFRAPYPVDPKALAARAGVAVETLKPWNQRAFARAATDASAPMLLPAAVVEVVDAALAADELPRATPRSQRAPAIAKTGGRIHRVASGDSLWTISRRYRVQLADLMRWNGLDKRSVLRIGQTLIVQDKS
jgi:membrane-bound lytic murein transglycosylase D